MAIITISRGTFSGGRSLAECVAAKLGYRCISREVLAGAAKQYGAPEEKLYEALTEKPGVLERLTGGRTRYLAYIRAALCKEARDDNLMYHGHAGHLLLKDFPNVLRIRVIAKMEFRITAAMERHHLSREKAIEFIKTVDEKRVRWTRFLYHVDWTDPSLYDLVLNLDHLSLAGACEVVCHAASMPQYETTLESQKIMDDLVLSSNVRAIIATHKEISDGNVAIEADEGVVTVRGMVGSLVDADRVRMIVRKVPGVKEINSKMLVRLAGVTTAKM